MDSLGPSFASSELEQALKEQIYGIKSSIIIKKLPMESTADVVTLEGSTVRIRLTPRGYEVSLRFYNHDTAVV